MIEFIKNLYSKAVLSKQIRKLAKKMWPLNETFNLKVASYAQGYYSTGEYVRTDIALFPEHLVEEIPKDKLIPIILETDTAPIPGLFSEEGVKEARRNIRQAGLEKAVHLAKKLKSEFPYFRILIEGKDIPPERDLIGYFGTNPESSI